MVQVLAGHHGILNPGPIPEVFTHNPLIAEFNRIINLTIPGIHKERYWWQVFFMASNQKQKAEKQYPPEFI